LQSGADQSKLAGVKPLAQNNVRGGAATPSSNGARAGRIRSIDLAKGLMARVLHPRHLWTAAKLHRHRRAHRNTADDAVLALYASILPDDFLHYGYFDDLTARPEDMPYAELGRAQVRYAKLLLDYVIDAAHPVLDAGCGMGGLCRMLRERGFDPVALTPDRTQCAHIAKNQPQMPLVRSKLENISASDYAGRFGTIITAESLQYMKLDRALPVLAAVLKPGGRWIMSDYYRLSPEGDRSCHCWSEFRQRVGDDGWRFVAERDITANVLPALAFVHMWVSRLAIPAMHMGVSRLRRRQPGLHHLLGGVLDVLERVVHENFQRIDPRWFAANRCYMVAVLEKP
jgi:cyclopropane fatty-acyl-phospholipid synthase-like methyltransferase